MAITNQMITEYQHPRVKLVVGSTTIYESDLVSGSFSYRGGTTGGGAFAPGGCVISSASFTVYNRHGEYSNLFAEGTQVAVYIGYGASPQSATYDLLCTVYVSELTKSSSKIMIKSFDKLRDADKKKWTTFSFPMTVREIIQSAATEASITVSQLPSTTAGGNISVDLRDDEGNQPNLSMTCRQAISQALLISGHYGYMSPSGQLVCDWYSASVDVTIPNSWIFDYNMSDSQHYTGVQVYGQQPTGATTRLYVLSSGKFITEANCAQIQSRLFAALVTNNVPVRKCSFSAVCNPNIRPGQIVQFTVPQGGSQTTIAVPITAMTIKGSLKASYSSESISADEADDLRKPDTVTQEDLEKAIEDISGGGGGDGDECEWIKLDGCFIWMKASSSFVHTYEKFDGVTLELVKQDNYHSDITQMVSREPGNTTQLSGFNSEDGIDIVKVQYLTQWIKVPVNDNDIRWLDIWVGDVTQPTLDDYKETYGNSFPEAVRQARRCNFECTGTRPGRVRIMVKRFKDDNNSFSKDFIAFGDSGSYYYEPYRPKALYNGLQLLTTEHIHYAPKGRIPYVAFYFPGHVYDLDEDNTSTYHKWCYIHRDSMGSPSVLELIPPYYFTTYAS